MWRKGFVALYLPSLSCFDDDEVKWGLNAMGVVVTCLSWSCHDRLAELKRHRPLLCHLLWGLSEQRTLSRLFTTSETRVSRAQDIADYVNLDTIFIEKWYLSTCFILLYITWFTNRCKAHWLSQVKFIESFFNLT